MVGLLLELERFAAQGTELPLRRARALCALPRPGIGFWLRTGTEYRDLTFAMRADERRTLFNGHGHVAPALTGEVGAARSRAGAEANSGNVDTRPVREGGRSRRLGPTAPVRPLA